MKKQDSRFDRENLIKNGILLSDDLSAKTFAKNNLTKLLAAASLLAIPRPLDFALSRAGINRKSFNRLSLASRKLMEYADKIGVDIDDTEYKDMIYIYHQITNAIADGDQRLLDMAEEHLKGRVDENGIKLRSDATTKEVLHFLDHVRGKSSNIKTIEEDDIDVQNGGKALEINTIEYIPYEKALEQSEKLQSDLIDNSVSNSKKLIDKIKKSLTSGD